MSSVYIHIPFCERKCIYCDFYSIENQGGTNNFLDTLLLEIGIASHYLVEEPIETIYFGGGTPSILDSDCILRILKSIIDKGSVLHDAEITIEVNPGTIDDKKIKSYRSIGINRISIGVQSFFDDDLRFLSRIHTVTQAEEAIICARQNGFENISIDLIYGLPTQTISKWKKVLYRALDFKPLHISAYSLIIEAGTPLSRRVDAKIVSPIPNEIESEMFAITMKLLAEAGYDHYEISNYAVPEFRSRHNSNYWNHTNYIGFGPSAHSFWNNKRWWNCRDIFLYEKKLSESVLPIEGSEVLTETQLINEVVMLGLRTGSLDLQKIKDRFNLTLNDRGKHFLEGSIEKKFIKIDGSILSLTDSGFLMTDSITEELLTCLI